MVMEQKDPNIGYEYVMNWYPRGSREKTPITNSCNRPWKAVTIDMYNNCMLCMCEGWVPVPVGKITDFERLEDIWNNPKAIEIQESVANKEFTWCAVEHCGIKHHNNYEDKYQVVFAIDDSCNLQCPSCRREKRLYESGPIYEEKLRAFQHTVDLLNKFEPRVHILFSCSGDPLASHISRPLLHSYVGKDSQTFTLFTNGLLIKKQLDKTALFQRITIYKISVDAGSKEVYEKIRVGGDWNVLMENFDFLKERNLSDKVSLQFVVQKKNYQDIPNFIKLCEKYNFRGILTQLDDWGTWNNHESKYPDAWTIKNGIFSDHDVLDSTHPEYTQCKTLVKSIMHVKGIELSPRLKSLLKL